MLNRTPHPFPWLAKPAMGETSPEVHHLLQVATHSLLTQFADVCEGALIVDRQARVVWMNEHYPKRLGLKNPEQFLGKPVEAMLPQSLMREVVETGRPIMLDIMNFGAEDAFVVMRMPLRDEQGTVIGGIGLMLLDNARHLAPVVSRYNDICRELNATRQQLALARRAKYNMSSLIGASPNLMEVKAQARRAARNHVSILIQGETGTGKELLAQAIHSASQRAEQPFVAVNIAAIPETLLEAEFFGAVAGAYTGADRKGRDGKFKLAEGGTLFLDEIGDMPLALQAKLLRVLQEGEYEALGSDRLVKSNVRIISATSRDLEQSLADGKFRADLYYRLNVVPLTLPPLRERLGDIPPLCESLLDSISHKYNQPPCELTSEALAYLALYHWPGNVRELQNLLERACMMTDSYVLQLSDIQRFLPKLTPTHQTLKTPMTPELSVAKSTLSLSEQVAHIEQQTIQTALAACHGNKVKAAQQLGISRTSLYEKLAQYGLA